MFVQEAAMEVITGNEPYRIATTDYPSTKINEFDKEILKVLSKAGVVRFECKYIHKTRGIKDKHRPDQYKITLTISITEGGFETSFKEMCFDFFMERGCYEQICISDIIYCLMSDYFIFKDEKDIGVDFIKSLMNFLIYEEDETKRLTILFEENYEKINSFLNGEQIESLEKLLQDY